MVLLTEGDNSLRGEVIVFDVGGCSLRDLVVLTVQATEIAARTGEGETGSARMEMVERLLLDGIDGEGTRLGVDLADKHAASISAAAADAGLAISNVAMMRTEPAFDLLILQTLIISALETIH
jgi:hypothetical protein